MANHVRIGIDVGGTNIEGIALDRDEEVTRLRIATLQHDYDGTVRAIVEVVGLPVAG
jgi:predicted NBD/HSP70 family sugar kinase